MMKRKFLSLVAIAAFGLGLMNVNAQAAPIESGETTVGETKAKPAPTPTPKPRKPGPRDEGDGE